MPERLPGVCVPAVGGLVGAIVRLPLGEVWNPTPAVSWECLSVILSGFCLA